MVYFRFRLSSLVLVLGEAAVPTAYSMATLLVEDFDRLLEVAAAVVHVKRCDRSMLEAGEVVERAIERSAAPLSKSL